MQFPQSSSIDYTQSQAKLLDALLKDNEHIDHYTTYVGEGSPRFVLTLEPELPRANFMQTIIVTKSLKDRDALFKDLQDQLNNQYPSALINMQFVQIGPPSKYPVMLRVSGPNASEVKTIANDVKAMMQQDKDLQNIALTGRIQSLLHKFISIQIRLVCLASIAMLYHFIYKAC